MCSKPVLIGSHFIGAGGQRHGEAERLGRLMTSSNLAGRLPLADPRLLPALDMFTRGHDDPAIFTLRLEQGLSGLGDAARGPLVRVETLGLDGVADQFAGDVHGEGHYRIAPCPLAVGLKPR
jgi:hypothetical protein